MKEIYAVTICEKTEKKYTRFHFKGFYLGHEIRYMLMKDGKFEIGEEYLILFTDISVLKGVLYGRVLKQKKLFN